MAAYMHGSLAVEERRMVESAVQQKQKQQQQQRTVRRKRVMPVQEKLIYLFTVFLCVIVAGVIIWRYAQIYEMNAKIEQIQQTIKQLEAENSTLKQMVNKINDPEKLKNDAQKSGLSQVGEGQTVIVPDKATLKGSEKLAVKP
ncbi:cell division protein FtsL [Paenibacillus cymbidii]|uniref:cell division protein FtsL n=1 Tax=Paenibacillus cymbidii TaxID=1639034 RepID=UPI001081F404|nr:cell division protein FtsL [Paenibacillus cymbidii]